jgi:hypothetical protein
MFNLAVARGFQHAVAFGFDVRDITLHVAADD